MLANASDPLQSAYAVEHGDVLLWIEMVLYREGELSGAPAPELTEQSGWAPAPHPAPRLRPVPVATAGEHTPEEHQPARRASDRVFIPSATRPPRVVTPELSDPATGAGSSRALQRDLILSAAWPSVDGMGTVVMALNVRPAPDQDGNVDPAATEAIMRAVVETVPFALRARDRVYRLNSEELALLLNDTDVDGALVAVRRLQEALMGVLAMRRLPALHVGVRELDPRSLAAVPAGPPADIGAA